MWMLVVLALSLHNEPILPPVSLMDLEAFPTRSASCAACNAAKRHRDWCREQHALNLQPQLPWPIWIEQAERTAVCWERLEDAHLTSWFGVSWQLDCLAELRREIGWQAYYCGGMPDPRYVYEMPVKPWEPLENPLEELD